MNQNKPIGVSVIIPVYNGENSIKNCLEGVCRQDLNSFEVIVIDDGSTDSTASIIKNMANEDSKIVYFYQENQGAGAARNLGMLNARGEYICFLDADDHYPTDDTLSKLYHKACDHEAIICGGSFCSIFPDGRIVDNFTGFSAPYTFKTEGWMNFSEYQWDYGYHRFLYKHEFLRKNCITFPNYRRYQDPPFMLKSFAIAKKFYAIPDVTYCYLHNEGKVNWTKGKVDDLICGLKECLNLTKQYHLPLLRKRTWRRILTDYRAVILSRYHLSVIEFGIRGIRKVYRTIQKIASSKR